MRILITGGAGFIGSHLADKLIESGHYVVVMDNLSGGFYRNVSIKARFIRADITDKKAVDDIVFSVGPNVILHCAAYAAEGISPFIKSFNYETNLIGSTNLIDAAIANRVKKFVFFSSSAVYGDTQNFAKETDACTPLDSYSIAKLSVERELVNAQKMFGLEYLILRPHNVYGPRQNLADPYRNVVGIFIKNLLSGDPLTIFGTGGQVRQFTYVHDIVSVTEDLIRDSSKWNTVYNVGSDSVCTVRNLADKLSLLCGVDNPTRIHLMHEREHEANEVCVSHDKVRGAVKCTSSVLDFGLQKMVAWAKELTLANVCEGRKDPFKIELLRGLPDSWIPNLKKRGSL